MTNYLETYVEYRVIVEQYEQENVDYITNGALKQFLKIPYGAGPKLLKEIHSKSIMAKWHCQ